MIKFTHKDETLAYMPREGATIEQVKACRQIVADGAGLDLLSVIVKFKS